MYTPIDITDTLSQQITSDKPPFILHREKGLITTNIYFQQNMQGYFEFQVSVNNTEPPSSTVVTNHFYDIANVSVSKYIEYVGHDVIRMVKTIYLIVSLHISLNIPMRIINYIAAISTVYLSTNE